MYRQGLMVQGDYYRGDGIFSFLGKALKTVAPILPFGIGTAASAVGSIFSPSRTTATQVRVTPPILQNQIGATLPPAPHFYGVQVGGTKLGLTTPGASMPVMRGQPVPGKKRRRMNVTNPRALRRAIRRARGFEKMARKVLGFTTPRKPKGRAFFRARAKR